jgi:hypothetical protein
MEYLSSPRSPRRATGIAAGLLIVLVAGAGLFLWWSDLVQRRADESFASAVAEAQARTRVGEATVLSTLAYASPMIWSASVPDGVRSDLRTLVEASAARAADGLATARGEASGALVLPWQRTQLDTRDRVLALIDELRHRFDSIAADAAAIGRVMARPAPSGAGVLR